MIFSIPEIAWNAREPILGVDLHGPSGRLVTAGGDKTVKIWMLNRPTASSPLPSVTFLSEITQHEKAVNVARFSPDGTMLATAGDDGLVLIWALDEQQQQQQQPEQQPSSIEEATGSGVELAERWVRRATLRGHLADVYDLCWSPTSEELVSGSIDNQIHVWNVPRQQSSQRWVDHTGYVQGVTWDPVSEFVATQSSDRSCRVHRRGRRRKRFAPHNVLRYMPDAKERLYQDETVPSFFRRLSFSPDGSFLATPTGSAGSGAAARPCVYLFHRANLAAPVLRLPCQHPSVAVRFSPVYYRARRGPEGALTSLPYRMVFAVATTRRVVVYDTEQATPLALLKGLHFASITDVAWSGDGLSLVASSADGYCTLVAFEEGELGEPLADQAAVAARVAAARDALTAEEEAAATAAAAVAGEGGAEEEKAAAAPAAPDSGKTSIKTSDEDALGFVRERLQAGQKVTLALMCKELRMGSKRAKRLLSQVAPDATGGSPPPPPPAKRARAAAEAIAVE